MTDSFEQNLFNNLMNTWVTPKIEERQAKGELEKPVLLQMAQIIFSADGGKPEVRINDEVKGRAIVKLSDKVTDGVKAGDPVTQSQIGGIEQFELEDEDRDCGHATLIYNGSSWFISFDFIYNKSASQNHLSAAKEFVHAAKSSFDGNYQRACIDNLHSAAELAGKAYLLGSPDNELKKAKTHSVVHSKLNAQRKLGNIDDSHVGTFNMLSNLRTSARYLQGNLEIGNEDLERMIRDVEEFVNDINERSKSKL